MVTTTVDHDRSHASTSSVKSKQGLFERLRTRRAGRLPVATPAAEHSTYPNPHGDTTILPAVPGAPDVEVVEHFSPAQLDTRAEWAKVSRIATAVLEGIVSDERALKDLGARIPEITTKVTRRRRQARNIAGAEALADGLRVSHEVGTLPPPLTDEGDRAALRGAKTIVGRALHAERAASDETGLLEGLHFDSPLPPAAASPSGRVAGAGIVHRQRVNCAVALAACAAGDPPEANGDGKAAEPVEFLPTWRDVDCAQCLAPAPVEVTRVLAPPHPWDAVRSDGSAPSAPVPPAEVQPAVPREPSPQASKLPRRRRATSFPAAMSADPGRPLDGDKYEAVELTVRPGAWLLDGGAWRLVSTVALDAEAKSVAVTLADETEIPPFGHDAPVWLLDADEAARMALAAGTEAHR